MVLVLVQGIEGGWKLLFYPTKEKFLLCCYWDQFRW